MVHGASPLLPNALHRPAELCWEGPLRNRDTEKSRLSVGLLDLHPAIARIQRAADPGKRTGKHDHRVPQSRGRQHEPYVTAKEIEGSFGRRTS